VTAAIVEGVAIELELETQPFLISSAGMGGGPQLSRSAAGDATNLMTAINGETTGRQDR
jgi:general secretion pathway protein A